MRARLDGPTDVGAGTDADPAEADPPVGSTRRCSPRSRGGEPNVRVIATGGSHRLDITDLDRVGLFADTAGLLAAEGHTVRTAILRTVDGVAVNEWHVESPSGAVPDPARIERGLARLGRGDRAPLATLDRRRAHVARPSGQASIGTPGPGARPGRSRREQRRHGARGARPGPARACSTSSAPRSPGAGISVRSAHIATYAGQTLDTFYLTGSDGLPLPPARVAQAVSLVIDTCDGI